MKYEANLIKAIQTGRRKLGLEEEEYRLLVGSVSNGKTSSKELTIKQMQALLDRMRELGFRPATEKQMLKIRALWHSLADEGIVRTDTDAAISVFIKRITKKLPNSCKVEDLSRVIEVLKKWIARIEDSETRERLEEEFLDNPITIKAG